MNQTTAFNSAVLPPQNMADNATDTYSNNLMDDLFSDVDQILGGDLSGYMTVVGRKPKPIRSTLSTPRTAPRTSGTAPTVRAPRGSAIQLPSNFSASASSHQPSHVGPSVGDRSYVLNVRAAAPQPTRRAVTRNKGFGGGRPVTAPRRTAAAAQSGNFQSAVIQSQDAQSAYGAPNQHIQPVSNYLYPKSAQTQRDFTFASPRPHQTIFEPEAQKQVSLPFLLIGAASISAVSTVGLWALSQNAPSTGWLLSLNREASAAEIPSNSTEDFLAYLGQSLDVISARQANNTQTLSAVIPVANRTSTLPTTVPNTNPAPQSGVLPNLPGAATVAATPSVIERVFVPVYQNAQQNNAQPAPAVPSVAVPSANTQLPKVPVPAPVAAAAAIPPGAPANAAPSVPIVSAGAATLPTPAPAAIAISPANAAAAVADTTPTSEHVLVGVLNLGSRSAALFNIEGTSQRAYVGDRVGVSDWTLVSVNGQDVQVRRDGEVRSVYIGQRF